MRKFGQGATEYLVLLAVVLIVALVSVALLGFFPGMASDSQLTQSKTYWSSASPIAIIESGAVYQTDTYTVLYLRLRNVGGYPIRISKILGNGGYNNTYIYNGTAYAVFEPFFYLAPGEEKYFGHNPYFSVPVNYGLFATKSSASSGTIAGADSICESSSRGVFSMANFGFEYTQYVENQQITKRQVGAKPLIIKCTG